MGPMLWVCLGRQRAQEPEQGSEMEPDLALARACLGLEYWGSERACLVRGLGRPELEQVLPVLARAQVSLACSVLETAATAGSTLPKRQDRTQLAD